MATIIETTIKDIIDEFDFNQVRRIMEAMNWRYFDDTKAAPSISRLKSVAESLMWHAVSRLADENLPSTSCATGGFKAEARLSDNQVAEISLAFNAVSMSRSIY